MAKTHTLHTFYNKIYNYHIIFLNFHDAEFIEWFKIFNKFNRQITSQNLCNYTIVD